jgi:hypothetical protein
MRFRFGIKYTKCLCILVAALAVSSWTTAEHAASDPASPPLTVEQQSFMDRVAGKIEDNRPVPIYCIRGSITPESTEFIRQILSLGEGLTRFNGTDFVRWKTTATDGSGIVLGQPITLTWSIVRDGVNVDGANTPSDLKVRFDAAFGSRAAWKDLLQEVFDQWDAKTGITYIHVPDDGTAFPGSPGVLGLRGDIRIGGSDIDGDGPGIIAFNYFPSGGGDMVLDTANAEDTFSIPDDDFRLLKNTVSHEHGHALGFGHVCPLDGTKIMEPRLAETFDHSGSDDIANANRKYGDAYESNGRNDSPATATDLGAAITQTLGDGSDPQRQIAGLDSVFDDDFYALDLLAGESISFVLRPQGTTFSFADDNGSLCDTVTTSPLASGLVMDLSVQFLDVDGTTILAQAVLNGVGADEFISRTDISVSGTYFVRVFTTDLQLATDDDQVQLYALDIELPGLDTLPISAANRWSKFATAIALLMLGIMMLSGKGRLPTD